MKYGDLHNNTEIYSQGKREISLTEDLRNGFKMEAIKAEDLFLLFFSNSKILVAWEMQLREK